MQPTVTEDGWITEVGSSVFEKEGIQGTAILLSSTQKEKLVNVQVLLNGEAYINDMTAFLETLKIKAVSGTTGEQGSPAIENKKISNGKKAIEEITAGPKADVWVYVRATVTDITTLTAKYKPNYFIVYPNGDYYPGFPPITIPVFHSMDCIHSIILKSKMTPGVK